MLQSKLFSALAAAVGVVAAALVTAVPPAWAPILQALAAACAALGATTKAVQS